MNDYDVSIFIVTDDNQYVPIEDYDKENMVGEFIMMTNDELNSDVDDDNSLLIHRQGAESIVLNHEIITKNTYLWQLTEEEIPNINCLDSRKNIHLYSFNNSEEKESVARFTLNGYRDTIDIINNAMKLYNNDTNLLNKRLPVISFAYNSVLRFNGKFYHGYLPAIGQWIYILHNRTKILNVIKILLDIKLVPDVKYLKSLWWSSTYDHSYLVWGILNYDIASIPKDSNKGYVLPLYKIE